MTNIGLNWTEFLKGVEVGRRLKLQRLSTRTPVAYLYNGVRLPKLPEWDIASAPYATIGVSNDKYYIYCTSTPRGGSTSGTLVITSYAYAFQLDDNNWVTRTSGVLTYKPIWANYDMLYSDYSGELSGTLFLSASEPIPVYE